MAAFGFASAAEFLACPKAKQPSCLLLDVRLEGISGLELQAELIRSNVRIPTILMTGYGDIPLSVRAMKAGAIDFLAKPFSDDDLLSAIHDAHEQSRIHLAQDDFLSNLKELYSSLTPREREVMWLAISGLLNKQIAAELGTREVTVKIHRGHAMKKMRADSFADLVRMGQALDQAGLRSMISQSRSDVF